MRGKMRDDGTWEVVKRNREEFEIKVGFHRVIRRENDIR